MNYGFDVTDLTGAAICSEELTPLRFDRSEYTPFEEFVHRLDDLPSKPTRVSVRSLGVNGKVVNDRMDKYLGHLGESSSLLKEVLKSPRHYLVARNGEVKPRNTAHFDLGTFVHSAFLEPQKFDKVLIEPPANRGTIGGICTLIRYYWELLGRAQDADLSSMKMQDMRAKLAELETEAADAGYSFVDAQTSTIIKVLRAAYRTYGGGIIPRLLRCARSETSMYTTDPQTGLAVKIRPDAMLLEEHVGANVIVSVKTTSAPSPKAFMSDAARYRYELSEGMYLEVASHVTGRRFSGTLMIVAQTTIPFQVALIWLDAEDLQIGKYKYRQALDILHQCKTNNSWPGFDCMAEEGAHGILQIRFPEWIKYELEPQYIPQ
ncbi:MAG: PD-(D/E)XK nuclease-like domain-containing protein [Alistipes sp.]|jgi:hypothetical protein|uniref:PD-(D/E)XK nuclease-like domain-containing protein n=1 Tax=Alistipes sp. TaxID=1872444 RepID=UPI000D7AC88F|nr:MAG: hypothetical protein DBX40_07550 [Clostridiales bacterium]DAO17997.1 MAG TPA: Exodeoxyribonuclease 8 [Caudoviricetes sp.]